VPPSPGAKPSLPLGRSCPAMKCCANWTRALPAWRRNARAANLAGPSPPLIALTPEARQHVRALRAYYEEHERPEAARALRNALTAAWKRIITSGAAGLPAPRPCPHLTLPGRMWIKAGRYWIAYRTAPTPVIVAVFFETANIPSHL
jgi:plasmid stabilization system protein ParE